MKKIYEQDVKDHILKNEYIFGDLGHSQVIFEKGIIGGRTVMDCLIFSSKLGVIGIEIKTEYDSTKRLKGQLDNYSRICDFVYVACHDKHVEDIEGILKTNQQKHVGILSYTVFRDEIILGVMEEATRSPQRQSKDLLDVLWKPEILKLRNLAKDPSFTLAKAYNTTHFSVTRYRQAATGALSTRMSKRMLITEFINRFGEFESRNIIVNFFLYGLHHPEKIIKVHHFRKHDYNE